MLCVICQSPLSGKQKKFCSIKCKNACHQSYPVQYMRGVVRKLRLVEMAGGNCQECGYKKNLGALVFHHLDPSKKDFKLDSRHLSNRTWESCLKEYAKCRLLCGNCHTELHFPNLDLFNGQVMSHRGSAN